MLMLDTPVSLPRPCGANIAGVHRVRICRADAVQIIPRATDGLIAGNIIVASLSELSDWKTDLNGSFSESKKTHPQHGDFYEAQLTLSSFKITTDVVKNYLRTRNQFFAVWLTDRNNTTYFVRRMYLDSRLSTGGGKGSNAATWTFKSALPLPVALFTGNIQEP